MRLTTFLQRTIKPVMEKTMNLPIHGNRASVKVFINPNWQQAVSCLGHGQAKGLVGPKGEVYLWDAYWAIHSDIEYELDFEGQPYEWDSDIDIDVRGSGVPAIVINAPGVSEDVVELRPGGSIPHGNVPAAEIQPGLCHVYLSICPMQDLPMVKRLFNGQSPKDVNCG